MSNDASGHADRRSTPGNAPDWEAIARYLAGESSAAESAIVERWLEEHPGDRALVQRLDYIVTPEVEHVDGSRVILGPDSRLTVRGGYGTASRDVELSGDAYFDVHHDAAKPFAVHVAKAVIEDIGTTFTVESDGADTTTVAVLTGSVRL